MNIRIISIGTIWFFLLKITIAERWSRQISQTNVNPIIDDWVPIASKLVQQPEPAATSSVETLALPQANDRSENGRVLAYPNFVGAASNNAPSTFNFVHPYQFQRFQNQKGGQQQLQHQPPTSQSYFKFEMPSFGADGNRDNSAPIQTGYQIQHTFGPVANSQPVLAQSLFNQKSAYQPEFHSIPQQQHSQPPHHQQFTHQTPRKPARTNFPGVKDSKTAAQQDFSAQQNPFSYQKPSSFQAQYPLNPFRQEQIGSSEGQLHSANVGHDEEVQLLYVPYDTLYNQRHENAQQIGFENPKYNLVQEPVNPLQINNFYTQDPLEPIPDLGFDTPSTTSTTTTSTTFRPFPSTRKPETNVHQFLNPRFTTQSPAKPKPKPHQPPLAMFYHKTTNRVSPNDVVSALSSERTIAVLDAPAKQAPEVFIGPAGLLPPSGYTKFDLPYLSSFDHNNLDNNLHQTPFFVAPLSYKTPPGFSKLLLPEPHVGSIVVNKPFKTNEFIRDPTKRPLRPTQEAFIPTGGIRYSSIPTSRAPTTIKIQTTTTPANRWINSNDQQNRVTHAPNDYYFNQYQQETIKEVSSPRTHQTSTHRHRRPTTPPTPTESAFTQTVKPYANFKPMPSNIGRDEYFKKQISSSTQTLPPTTTTSTTTSTTTQSPTPKAQSYFTENFSRNPETTHQQFYDISTAAPEIIHRFQNKPLFDDEYRMKQYFRQQEAFKNRQTSTTPPAVYEKIQYTPVSLDYGRPSSTPHYYEGSTLRTTTPNQRFTFYHPTGTSSSEENFESNTLPPNNKNNKNLGTYSFERQSPAPEITIKPLGNRVQPTQESRLPANHRPTYDNEVTIYNHDDKSADSVEFEPNPYNIPSELPPITPNLPGLVNALRENERLNAIEKETTDAITTTSSTLRPTRRPIGNRGRRPTTTRTSTSTSMSYSSSDDVTTRRPINRRRPYTTKNTTVDSSVSRGPTNRNKSRYNPTPEERKQFRIKHRGEYSTSSTKGNKVKTEVDNIDYQRDVLKQNYPVFRHPTRKPYFTTTEKSDEIVTVTPNTLKDGFPGLLEPMQIAQQYQQQIQQDNFGPGYFPNEEEFNPTEPSRNEIKPVYSTSSTTPTTVTTDYYREEISKKPVFVRRPRPRTTTTTTTTEAPVTTAESIEPQRYTIKPRTRPDGSNNNLPRKVIKIRARTRKPHPASTTGVPEIDPKQKKDSNYQKVSRFNQDFYNNNEYKTEPTKRNQFRSKFNLEPQESQWSPSLLRKDSFKPVDPKENLKNIKIENEPDIITVGPQDTQKQDNFELNVSAGFGPSAKSYGSKDINTTEKKNDKRTEPTFEELLEEVMADIGREAAKKDEVPVKTSLQNKQTDVKDSVKVPIDQSNNRNAKSTNKNDKPHRRGVWKKVRVQPADGFETAESQNIGAHLYNSIAENEKTEELKHPEPTLSLENVNIPDSHSYTTDSTATTEKPPKSVTTTLSPESVNPETEIPYEIEPKVETVTSISEQISRRVISKKPRTTTQLPSPTTTTISPMNAEITTTRFYNQDYEQDDSVGDVITRRIDDTISDNYDLETQPSLFDEVRSQLKDLFAAEEDDDVEYGDVVKPNFQPRKHEYTSIQRVRAVTTIPNANEDDKPETTTESLENAFHKNLMKNVVFATSTSTTVDRETEICYRGRCVKAQKQT